MLGGNILCVLWLFAQCVVKEWASSAAPFITMNSSASLQLQLQLQVWGASLGAWNGLPIPTRGRGESSQWNDVDDFIRSDGQLRWRTPVRGVQGGFKLCFFGFSTFSVSRFVFRISAYSLTAIHAQKCARPLLILARRVRVVTFFVDGGRQARTRRSALRSHRG